MSLLIRLEELAASAQQAATKLALVDADRLPYLAALMADEYDHGPEHIEDLNRHILQTFYEKAEKYFPTTGWTYVFFLSRPSFRHALYDGYKANRKNVWQPPLRSYCNNSFQEITGAWRYDGYEADDLVSIAAHLLTSRSVECVSISNDKDLDQIPGKHFNPATDAVYDVSEAEARRFRFKQWIMGDSTDGYGGIYRVGEVKATDFLAGINVDEISDAEVSKAIHKFYKKKGQLHECETFRRLAWLLTDVLGTSAIPGS